MILLDVICGNLGSPTSHIGKSKQSFYFQKQAHRKGLSTANKNSPSIWYINKGWLTVNHTHPLTGFLKVLSCLSCPKQEVSTVQQLCLSHKLAHTACSAVSCCILLHRQVLTFSSSYGLLVIRVLRFSPTQRSL